MTGWIFETSFALPLPVIAVVQMPWHGIFARSDIGMMPGMMFGVWLPWHLSRGGGCRGFARFLGTGRNHQGAPLCEPFSCLALPD